MQRQLFIIIILLFCGVASSQTQTRKPYFGPVVSAYLTSLREELNELDFQLRQREIRFFSSVGDR